MANPVSSSNAAWNGKSSILNPSLPGKEAFTDGNKTKAIENSDTKIEHDQNKDRTVPTRQELESFVAQCRSST